MFSKEDERFMQIGYELALKGLGDTSSNPIVGALIVKSGKIIGRGYHSKAGSDHAEVVAIKNLTQSGKGSTLYVTLEPCNHIGKTASCAEAIIEAGISRVFIGCRDLSFKSGIKGARRLKAAGIKVEFARSDLKLQAMRLVDDFHTLELKKRPWVVLKIAESLDGKSATIDKDSKWITSLDSRREGHRLRKEADAILVGVNTVIKDDPDLTARYHKKRDKILRVVLDSKLSIPLDSKLANPGRSKLSMIFVSKSTDLKKAEELILRGVKIERVSSDARGYLDIEKVLRRLGELKIKRLLVEGGAKVAGSFLDKAMIDEVAVFIAPKLLGGDHSSVSGDMIKSMKDAFKLSFTDLKMIGDDIFIRGIKR